MKPLFIFIFFIALILLSITLLIFIPRVAPHILPNDNKKKDYKITCPVDSNLIKCNPNDKDSCKKCKGGFHSCYQVDDNHPYFFTYNNVKNKRVKVENGTWCLPTKTETLKCNQFSGYPVLVKVNEDTNAWVCHCRYPNLFENQGLYGDCTFQTACDHTINEKNNLVCPEGSKECTPGTPWTQESTYDPGAGVCKCDKNLKYLDQSQPGLGVYRKECVKDTCIPGKTITKNGITTCDCGSIQKNEDGTYKSYLKCPEDVKDSTSIGCSHEEPTCINDPCNPGGYYDRETGICKCPLPGTHLVGDKNSPVGWICQSPCSPDMNPCGERGTCYTVTNNNGDLVARCKDCIYPWVPGGARVCLKNECKPDYFCSFRLKPIGVNCSSNQDCMSGHCGSHWFSHDTCVY